MLSVAGLCLLATSAYVVLQRSFDPRKRVTAATCNDWLAEPGEGFVLLRNCRLQVEDVLIQSSEGDFELLARRANGVSSKLYQTPPTWVDAWAPVQPETRKTPTARAVLKITSSDLMKWINALDRAPENRRAEMWATPVLLQRHAHPASIEARAAQTEMDLAAKFGGSVSVNTYELISGLPEPAEAPLEGIVVGIVGLAMIGVSLRNATRARLVDSSSANPVISTSDVKLELGALEALKREDESFPDEK